MLCLSGFELYSRWVPLANEREEEILMRFDVCLGLPFVIQWSLCVYRRMYPPMSTLQFKEKLERIFEPILPHQYHQNRVHVASISCFFKVLWFLRQVGKTGNKLKT